MITSFTSAAGLGVSISQKLNISNKIMIISTMFLFFTLPIINLKKTFFDIKKINYKIILFILFFSAINIYYFDFPYIVGGSWGGGFFHKFSNIIFNNNLFFYIVFILSLLIIFSVLSKNKSNYLLLILLVLFNPQFTIYNKYYDPLIYILFLTLFKLDMNKHYFKKDNNNIQLFFLFIGYLGLAFYKNYFL
tara:strand:- start:194 stop:766 length:573 start_codon:yes stop_codon:yes gene_type:complete